MQDHRSQNLIESKDIDLREIFFIILRNLKLLIAVTIFSVVLIIFYSRLWPETFTANSSILIEQEQTDITSVFNLGDTSETNFLLNEIEILQSRTVRVKTAKYLYENYRDNLILFGTKKPQYSFLGKSARNLKKLFSSNDKNDLSTYETFVNSPLHESIIHNLKSKVSVSNPRKTDIIIVNYSSFGQDESAIILNALIEQYQKNDQEWAAGELIYLDEFLTKKYLKKKKN